MFDEIAGLPAHPLLVHAAVAAAPALAVVAIAYALLPAARTKTELPLAVLAVAGPLSVATARESGEALRRRLARNGTVTPDMLERIDAHATASRLLLLLTLALGAASFLWITLRRARKIRRDFLVLVIALAIVTCALSAAVVWSVIHTGHMGTSMVWERR